MQPPKASLCAARPTGGWRPPRAAAVSQLNRASRDELARGHKDPTICFSSLVLGVNAGGISFTILCAKEGYIFAP